MRRLAVCMNHPIEGFFRATVDGTDPCATRCLQKRVLTPTTLHSAKTLHLQCSDCDEGWLRQWRSRCEDDFTGPPKHTGVIGQWLVAASTSPQLRLAGDTVRWAWRDLLGIEQLGQIALCIRFLSCGLRCGAELDAHQHHCASCDWGAIVNTIAFAVFSANWR